MTTTDNSDADCCTLVSLKTNSTLAIPSLMLKRLISFSLLVKLNQRINQCHGFLWCCSSGIESNVSLNPRISVLNVVSTEFQFFYFVFFLWERFQWFFHLITDCIKNILFSRFDDHNNFVYTRLHLAFYLGYFRLKLSCFFGWIVRLPFVFPVLCLSKILSRSWSFFCVRR